MVSPERFPDPALDPPTASTVAVLAGGCFWCVEAVYKQLPGVTAVASGYAGGSEKDADYETVCSGTTGHAEAVEIRFDPATTSYGQLLKVFFSIAHDPTQRDRQGNDVGRQYRSAIFYADADQRRVAEAYIAQLDATKVFDTKIVTEVTPLERFYPAETYHQDYAARNPANPYIIFTAQPKVRKMREYLKSRGRVEAH